MFANPLIHFIDTLYRPFVRIGENLQSLFLLLLRVTWGHQFFLAGYHRLHGMDHVIQEFTTLSISHPIFSAYLVTWVELIGGICLVLGFASRLVSIPLMIAMISAFGLAHAHVFTHFQFIINPLSLVRAAPFPFLMTTIIVFIFGPGRISLDGWIKRLSQRWKRF